MARHSKLLCGVAAASAGCAFGAYVAVLRPRILRWGATQEEINRRWPGDELTPGSRAGCTRAITINAPTSKVWPWIMQIGQDRAGYYSYTALENLFRAEMHNTYRIVPEWQERHVGDTFWMAPRYRYGGEARMVVARLEPERALVLVNPQDAESAIEHGYAPHGSWTFLLEPIDCNTTRLVMRGVDGEQGPPWGAVAGFLFWQPAHFIMERKMMRTIKALAEGKFQAGSRRGRIRRIPIGA